MKTASRIALTIVCTLVVFTLSTVAAWQMARSRSFQLVGNLVQRVATDQPFVALTFDDGPTATYTPEILSALADHDVKATFFLTGREIVANPEAAQSIQDAGHEIGNHTWSHKRLVLVDTKTIAEEIERTDDAIRNLGRQGEILFRPPYGYKFVNLPLYLSRTQRTTIMWDVEPESYEAVAADSTLLAEHVIEHARPGSIIILHAMYESRQTTRDALPAIIDGLRERGFEFATVTELLALSRTPH